MVLKLPIFFVLLLCYTKSIAQSGWLGLTYREKASGQLVVEGVFPESAAMQAGVQPGDVLLSVGRTELRSGQDLRNIAGQLRVGQRVQIRVSRSGQSKTLEARLGKRPDDLRTFTGSLLGTRAEARTEHIYANANRLHRKPKVTILDFWATWCAPCRKTLPLLADLYRRRSNQGLEIIGLSSESVEVLQRFQQNNSLPYPLVHDRDGKQADKFAIRAIPTLLVLDSGGYVQRVFTGIPDSNLLEEVVVELLGGKSTDRKKSR